MGKTTIEWTEKTWNPIIGCSKYSEGCVNCYAEGMHNRIRSMKNGTKYKFPFNKVIEYKESLNEPYKWKKPSIIFVCSMSDIFHKDVSDKYIWRILNVIKENPQHMFQLLTKRTDRMNTFFSNNSSYIMENIPNIMLGTTIENQERANERVGYIIELGHLGYNTFISCEPLLTEIDFNKSIGIWTDIWHKKGISWLSSWINNIDWIIVGGESGPKSREMKKERIYKIKDFCDKNNIVFFFKQWGGKNKKKTGCLLDGKEYKNYPKFLLNK